MPLTRPDHLTTAKEALMSPDEVPHEYVMAAMKAAGLLHHDTARPALAAVLPTHRAQVLREAAALIRHHHGGEHHYAQVLDQAAADVATPTSKEPQR